MVKNKKILIIVSACAFLFALSVCSAKKKDINFPKDSKGYPKSNVILVNGEETVLPDITLTDGKMIHEVNAKIRKDGTVVVVLPQGIPINQWYIQESEEIKLISYIRESLFDGPGEKLEGPSSEIQTFCFSSAPSNTVLFKWVNINQSRKAFDEKDEDYLLKVRIYE